MRNDGITDDDLQNLRAAPWAIEAGLLLEKDGEILITAKGLAVMRQQLEKEGLISLRD